MQLRQCPGFGAPAPHKMHVVFPVCDAGIQEVEAGGPEVQGHSYPIVSSRQA